jgi:hypothetical protein
MATIAPAPAVVTAARENGNGNGLRVRINVHLITLVVTVVFNVGMMFYFVGKMTQRADDLEKGQAGIVQDVRDLAHRMDRLIERNIK